MNPIKKIKTIFREHSLKKDEESFQKEYYKNSVLSYPPRSLTLGISSACNNKCVFCAYHAEDAKNGKSNVQGLNYSISMENFKKIINICYRGRVPHVHICAPGEPFLHKNILEMIDYAIKIYGITSFQTNFHRAVFEKNNYYDEIIKRGRYVKYITTDVLSGDPDEHEALKKGSTYEDVFSTMEKISKHTNILFRVHLILTTYNYKHINNLIDDLHKRKINATLEIVNLHPHNFNQYTSNEAVYTSGNTDIEKALKEASELGKKKGIPVSVPQPFDSHKNPCGSFWTRLQTWPVAGNDPERYHENVIVGGCNAVVIGDLNTLGYFFDYENIMDLWNNEILVDIRKNLLNGVYPDKACVTCQSYMGS